jgi:hypothetical protein
MPSFETPDPISVTVELGVGDIQIEAGDRTDTIVHVRPSDPSKQGDVIAAEQTRVEFANGRLVIGAPRGWRHWSPWGGGESIGVKIDLPTGSRVAGEAGVAALRCSGRIGECRYRTGAGDIHLEEAGPVALKAGAGEVTVDAVVGKAEIKTAGAVRIGSVDGPAVVRNTNGDTWIGEVTGDARVHAANGGISIDLARATVAARTANGPVRIGDVASGAVHVQSAFGAVDVGIRDGAAAWLDLDTKFGSVQNDLDAAEAPPPGEDVVEVHAHTAYGDIRIRRAPSAERSPVTVDAAGSRRPQGGTS